MTKDKRKKLDNYLAQLKARLSGKVPSKHEGHPETFKAFLENEISLVKRTIETAELEGSK